VSMSSLTFIQDLLTPRHHSLPGHLNVKRSE
jgi:hypothetical protein